MREARTAAWTSANLEKQAHCVLLDPEVASRRRKGGMLSMSASARRPNADRLRRRILAGEEEPIFAALPERVLYNLRHPRSENALVWNLVYPLARPRLSLGSLLALRPLCGTPALSATEDDLEPYFWGYSIQGSCLTALNASLELLDGSGPQTEVDLFLLGSETLVLVEAKHGGTPGRCSRYEKGRCPEMHPENVPPGGTCRYWELEGSRFDQLLDFGPRPAPGDDRPPCAVHYQLARTLLLGKMLAGRLGRRPHLWLIVPVGRWPGLQTAWLDFAERVRDEELWRRLRVLAWEDLRGLSEI
jgi:hypothetical protein